MSSAFAAVPLVTLAEAQRESFERPSTNIWPEVGSRAMQRLVEDDGSSPGDGSLPNLAGTGISRSRPKLGRSFGSS